MSRNSERNVLVLKIIGVILILFILLLSIIQNLASVALHFLFWKFNLPVIALILIFLFLGFVLGLLGASIWFPKKKSDESVVSETEDE